MHVARSETAVPSRVACPLCGHGGHHPVESIRLADLDHEYRRQLGVTVLDEFPAGRAGLELVRCDRCGLEHYAGGVAGSAQFYAAIARSQQYYSTTRWEFAETLKRLPAEPDLVDIGCGDGCFLSLVSGSRKRGLELNPVAVEKARARGLDVREGLLPVLPDASADVLTMFQVLEHVSEPAAVLKDTARVLRPGGLLVVAVPNNDAYIGRALQDPLNAPPHHPLRWRAPALRYVPEVAPYRLEELLLEPLAAEHLYSYRRTRFVDGMDRLLGRRLPRYRVSAGTTLLRRVANVWTRLSMVVSPRGPGAPGTGFSLLAFFRRL